jgi:undecaprenyl-diphosphatase
MGIFEAVVLGLVQGLTEFIPVSSSGHLVIVQHLFSGSSDHMFLEWIDLGTLLALVVYFRHRLVDIVRDIFIERDYRLARNVLITALPAGLIGLLLSKFIEESAFFSSFLTVTIALGLVGMVMVILDKLPRASSLKDGEHMSSGRALTIGFVQVLALIPGVSRSGSTIIAGRLMGLSARQAAEYSFLVSIPIMTGLVLKLVVSASDRQYYMDHFFMLSLSNGVAFLSGLFAVGFMINYLSKHGLTLFGWYRVGLSAVLLVALLLQLVR